MRACVCRIEAVRACFEICCKLNILLLGYLPGGTGKFYLVYSFNISERCTSAERNVGCISYIIFIEFSKMVYNYIIIIIIT
jgi:hypothetical protein